MSETKMIAVLQCGVGEGLPLPSDLLVDGTQAKGDQVLKERKGIVVAHHLKMEMGLE
jgi:hypothetical protein